MPCSSRRKAARAGPSAPTGTPSASAAAARPPAGSPVWHAPFCWHASLCRRRAQQSGAVCARLRASTWAARQGRRHLAPAGRGGAARRQVQDVQIAEAALARRSRSVHRGGRHEGETRRESYRCRAPAPQAQLPAPLARRPPHSAHAAPRPLLACSPLADPARSLVTRRPHHRSTRGAPSSELPFWPTALCIRAGTGGVGGEGALFTGAPGLGEAAEEQERGIEPHHAVAWCQGQAWTRARRHATGQQW